MQTDVFSSVAKAAPAQPAAAAVQTGGFSGASKAAPQSDKVTQIVAAGFGEAGVAPSAGSRRVVAAGGGFGDAGVATAAVTRRLASTSGEGFGDAGVTAPAVVSGGSVRASSFGDAITAAPTAAGKQAAALPTTAAQIIEKPNPVYTEEARRLGIEGEVQLEVRFRATGEVEIVRVVRGLGHGLDENAAKAARTIRFLPAKREGLPVDSTATIRITFQLAS
jgi:TonB family protein